MWRSTVNSQCSQCEFISVWLPCAFCESQNGELPTPCFKLTSSSFNVPQPISTSSLSHGEALLLQHAYSLTVTINASLIKQVGLAFGVAITLEPLRNSVLAYAIHRLPEDPASAPKFAELFELHT